jgi:two-component system sensor histidine kinase KdpD
MLPGSLPSWLTHRFAGFIGSTLVLGGLTAVLAPLLGDDQLVNVALLFFLVVLLTSTVWGYPAGLFTAVLAVLLLNFFFVPPLHTITVHEPRAVVSLLLFLAVAAIGASMLALLRRQVALAQSREAEANALLEVSQALAAAPSPQHVLEALCAAVARSLGADGCAILRDRAGWSVVASTADAASTAAPTRDEESMAAEAIRTRSTVGRGGPMSARVRTSSATPPRAPMLFVPFPSDARDRAVLRVVGPLRNVPPAMPAGLLWALAAEASAALERAELAIEAGQVETLRRADALKSLLLSSVSHDLRSPLTAIKAAVGNLRDPDVDWNETDIKVFLAAIEEQTDRLAATVDDLLQMSRLEEGVVEPIMEPVQVSLLLRDAAQAAKPATAGRTVTVESDDDLWIRADYGLLMRALDNLIENAARYSRAGGGIHLGARTDGDSVRVFVRDSGPGIPQQDLPHVFEKFYRGAQSKQTTGTGLGLSIVQAIAELCGGRVSARSSADATEFALDLPALAVAP